MSRQSLFYILRKRYNLKLQMIGWLAGQHHATIIHSIKVMDGMLDIKDHLALASLDMWVSVFKREFGSEGGLKQSFGVELDRIVIESGLEHSVVEKLLRTRAEDISKLRQGSVSL